MDNISRPPSLGPLAGAAYLLRGLAMLGQPGLRHFVWLPLLINLSLYGVGAWVGAHYFSAALDWLVPGWLDWLRWLLWPLFALLLSAIVLFSFTLLANIVASPFYGPLAEKVLRNAGVPVADGGEGGLLAAWAVDLGSELRRAAYFGLRALPLLLLSAVPGLNLAAPPLWLLYGAWSLSLEYLAYPLEARGVRFDRQRALAAERRLESLGFGGAVLLGLAVPVLNVLIPPAAVIGATLCVADRERASASRP
jgi:CysZ protein